MATEYFVAVDLYFQFRNGELVSQFSPKGITRRATRATSRISPSRSSSASFLRKPRELRGAFKGAGSGARPIVVKYDLVAGELPGGCLPFRVFT